MITTKNIAEGESSETLKIALLQMESLKLSPITDNHKPRSREGKLFFLRIPIKIGYCRKIIGMARAALLPMHQRVTEQVKPPRG